MGKYIKGILGSFQGKVGTVIGSSWKGIEYMRSRGKKSSKPPTQAQLVQQAKFTLLIKFVTTMGRLLTVTFKDSAIKMTGVNSAFAYNYDNAITGNYPAFSLDYSKVLVSKGQLHNAINPVITTSGAGVLKADFRRRWCSDSFTGPSQQPMSAAVLSPTNGVEQRESSLIFN